MSTIWLFCIYLVYSSTFVHDTCPVFKIPPTGCHHDWARVHHASDHNSWVWNIRDAACMSSNHSIEKKNWRMLHSMFMTVHYLWSSSSFEWKSTDFFLKTLQTYHLCFIEDEQCFLVWHFLCVSSVFKFSIDKQVLFYCFH